MGYEAPLTRRDAVGQYLRDEILSGALAPGSAIKDAEIAQRLKVSITPVREAITQLISEGLIEALPNKRRRVILIDERNAIELLDVLGVVLVAALDRAAAQLTEDDISLLAASVERQRTLLAADDMPGSRAVALELIGIVAAAARHDELRSLMDHVVNRALTRLHLFRHPDLDYIWTDGWRETVALLAAGEPDAAVQRLRKVFWVLTASLPDGA